MLCTSLGTFTDYKRWMTDSGFAEIRAHDVTRQVEKAWDFAQQILCRPAVRAFFAAHGIANTAVYDRFQRNAPRLPRGNDALRDV
jgi:hypothetical protein